MNRPVRINRVYKNRTQYINKLHLEVEETDIRTAYCCVGLAPPGGSKTGGGGGGGGQTEGGKGGNNR